MFSSLFLAHNSFAVDKVITWGSHFGPSAPYFKFGFSDPSTIIPLKDFSGSSLNGSTWGSGAPNADGDLIQLGFFDLDLTAGDSVYTPNTSSTDLFKGTWTPLTEQTRIGHPRSGTSDGIDGQFGFSTTFAESDPAGTIDTQARTNNLLTATYKITETVGTLGSSSLQDKVVDLNAETGAYIGVRFYDGSGSLYDASSDASLRYNTIMSTDWTWLGGEINFYDGTSLDSDIVYEYDNTDAYSADIAKIGSSSVRIPNDDFTATLTYLGASSTDILNVGNSGVGSSVFSNLAGQGRLYGAQDGNTITIHSQSYNTGAYATDFEGDIYATAGGTGSTDLTIIKTGTGEQIFSGNIKTLDNDSTESGYLNIAEGTITLKPGGSKSQSFEFLTGAATGGTLKLDNSVNSGQILELGFANTAEKKTFSGTLTLSASGTNTLNVGGDSNFNAHQEISGAISNDGAKLVKTGGGKLTLSADSSSFNVAEGITIGEGDTSTPTKGGVLVANNADALGSGSVRIEYGKLSVAGGKTISNTILGETTNRTNAKSIIGGGVGNGAGIATITNGGSRLNIGSANDQIDVVSPGIALSSSMSNGTSDYQAVFGDLNDAGTATLSNSIGTLKINDVGLMSGGVYDWEIANFDGTNTNGADWDVLSFDSLTFDSSGDFDINIMSLDGSSAGVGGVSGNTFADKTGTSGFKFIDGSGTNGSGITWGSVTISGSSPSASGTIDSGYFDIFSDNFSHYNNNHYGEWSVYYDHANNDFYMQYSVAPEPSTYIMVAGLLMLPGYNFIRRFRKTGDENKEV